LSNADPEYFLVSGLVFTTVNEPYLESEYGQEYTSEAPVKLLDRCDAIKCNGEWQVIKDRDQHVRGVQRNHSLEMRRRQERLVGQWRQGVRAIQADFDVKRKCADKIGLHSHSTSGRHVRTPPTHIHTHRVCPASVPQQQPAPDLHELGWRAGFGMPTPSRTICLSFCALILSNASTHTTPHPPANKTPMLTCKCNST